MDPAKIDVELVSFVGRSVYGPQLPVPMKVMMKPIAWPLEDWGDLGGLYYLFPEDWGNLVGSICFYLFAAGTKTLSTHELAL